MLHKFLSALLLCLLGSAGIFAQAGLDPKSPPRYGSQVIAPGFQPAPFQAALISGGDQNVAALNLGANCLGFAAADPDFALQLHADFPQITFAVDSGADTTLIINLPDGGWACDDDSNGLNPALVFADAAAGVYRIWVGSFSAGTHSDSTLWVSESSADALPTTATGPDPARDPLYGTVELAPGFLPEPFQVQLIGGGRSDSAEFIRADCAGYVAEAPDYSIHLRENFAGIWFAVHSPAEMTLLVNAADGSWHCSADAPGADPAIGFASAPSGLYDVWVGSADEDNYAASILYVSEFPPSETSHFRIDTACPNQPATALQVGSYAQVARSGGSLHSAPRPAAAAVAHPQFGRGMQLIGGPVCEGGQRWWRAALFDGKRGWIADGDAGTAWLEPLAQQ